MKKFFTLLLSSLFSLSLLASDGSRLSVSTISNKMNLKLEIDGRLIEMKDNTITLSYLPEGYHQVKIFREKKKNGIGPGFGRRKDIIFSNSILLKSGFHSDITVNRFGKVFIDERRIDRNDDWYNDDDDVYYDNNGNNNGGWNNGYGNVMNARDFDQVKESLRKEWFENNRLKSAKFIIDNNNLMSLQVKELMLLFTFEDKKLEIAKYAYRKTIDKQSYYQVNDALTFNSSKEELARFIRESR